MKIIYTPKEPYEIGCSNCGTVFSWDGSDLKFDHEYYVVCPICGKKYVIPYSENLERLYDACKKQ